MKLDMSWRIKIKPSFFMVIGNRTQGFTHARQSRLQSFKLIFKIRTENIDEVSVQKREHLNV